MADSKRQVEANELNVVHPDSDRKLSRALGLTERVLLERERVNNFGTVTSVLLLESKEELNQDLLKKALSLLPKRYPLLRMRINERARKVCFEEMDDPCMVDFQALDSVTADKWEEGFEQEINGYSFDIAEGPLWHVRQLKETFNGEQFRNVLLFTFLHIICDALSIFELQKQLMEFLNSLHNGEEFEVKSLLFRPPLESLMSNLVEPSIGEKMLFSSFFMFQRVKNVFAKSDNLYLSVYPPVANSDPSVPKKTCILSRSLSEEQTRLWITNCKANKCTVHGAITASTHLAITRILQRKQHDLITPIVLDSSYSFSARKDCKVGSEEFGIYVSGSALSVPVPLIYPDDQQGFWEFARACTREVHTQIETGKHRDLMKLFHCVDIPAYCQMSNSEYNQGRISQILNITNCGAQKLNQNEGSAYKFAGWYFGLQGTKASHTFGNNIATVDGKLYWAVEYFPHVTSKTQAEDFANLSLQILFDACVEIQ